MLFVVLTAHQTRHRALLAHHSWCAGANCLFVAEDALGERWQPAPRWAQLHLGAPTDGLLPRVAILLLCAQAHPASTAATGAPLGRGHKDVRWW